MGRLMGRDPGSDSTPGGAVNVLARLSTEMWREEITAQRVTVLILCTGIPAQKQNVRSRPPAALPGASLAAGGDKNVSSQ